MSETHEPVMETANIHLEAFGQQYVFLIPFPLGEQPIGALLPFMQELTNQLASISVAKAESEGKKISCQAGCGACCRQLVAISFVEAHHLARVVNEMPPERQAVIRERFAQGIAKLEAAGLLDKEGPPGMRDLLDTEPGAVKSSIPRIAKRYFELGVACPFLENESCSIYPDRPLVCREYHVTSPAERCPQIYQIGVDPVEVPRHPGEHLTRTAHALVGLPKQMIPLILSLEYAAAHPPPDKKLDSVQIIQHFLADMAENKK
jgi:Fe-S-cluster containining protein